MNGTELINDWPCYTINVSRAYPFSKKNMHMNMYNCFITLLIGWTAKGLLSHKLLILYRLSIWYRN